MQNIYQEIQDKLTEIYELFIRQGNGRIPPYSMDELPEDVLTLCERDFAAAFLQLWGANEELHEDNKWRAGCPDCGATASASEVGTVCRHCGRGVIESQEPIQPSERTFTVIGVYDSTGQVVCDHVKATEGQLAMRAAALLPERMDDDYCLVAAIPMKLSESENTVEFSGEGIVDRLAYLNLFDGQ